MPGHAEGAAGAPADTAEQSIARVPDGCDTDENGSDLRLAAITPGASNGEPACSAAPGDAAPAVASTDPANGDGGVAPDGSLAVTFSEPVTAGADAFALDLHRREHDRGDRVRRPTRRPSRSLPRRPCRAASAAR